MENKGSPIFPAGDGSPLPVGATVIGWGDDVTRDPFVPSVPELEGSQVYVFWNYDEIIWLGNDRDVALQVAKNYETQPDIWDVNSYGWSWGPEENGGDE